MHRRYRGAPLEWLCGIILTALGTGMLLACLIPKFVYLAGICLICLGCWIIRR